MDQRYRRFKEIPLRFFCAATFLCALTAPAASFEEEGCEEEFSSPLLSAVYEGDEKYKIKSGVRERPELPEWALEVRRLYERGTKPLSLDEYLMQVEEVPLSRASRDAYRESYLRYKEQFKGDTDEEGVIEENLSQAGYNRADPEEAKRIARAVKAERKSEGGYDRLMPSRIAAVHTLRDKGCTERAEALADLYYEVEGRELRRALAVAIATLDGELAGEHLTAVLTDNDWSLRASAVEGLARVADEGASAEIASLRFDPSWKVRFQVYVALASRPVEEVGEAIVDMLSRPADTFVVEAALEILEGQISRDTEFPEEIGEELKEKLEEAASGKDRRLAGKASTLLSSMESSP